MEINMEIKMWFQRPEQLGVRSTPKMQHAACRELREECEWDLRASLQGSPMLVGVREVGMEGEEP